MKSEIAIIGAGSAGLYTALDLRLRGFEVSLFDRSVAGSGTSGKFHGLLHSGARYAVTDKRAAIECISESNILKQIAGHCIDDTGGLFVSISRQDSEYGEQLRKALDSCGIKYENMDADETIAAEPRLSPEVVESISVPDAVLLGSEFISSLALSCISMGVRYHPFRELQSARVAGDEIHSLTFRSTIDGRTETEKTDFVVNATGPWTGRTSEILGAKFNILPVAGTMLLMSEKYASRVINRMRKPSDGDIIVPYGMHSILGTTASMAEDPDSVYVDDLDVELLLEEATFMIPLISAFDIVRTYSSVRPVIMSGEMKSDGPRAATRDFTVQAGKETGLSNLVTLSGGKMTTSRLMGEETADTVSSILGGGAACRTASFTLAVPRLPDNIGLPTYRGNDMLQVSLAALKGGIDEERQKALMLLAMINCDSREK